MSNRIRTDRVANRKMDRKEELRHYRLLKFKCLEFLRIYDYTQEKTIENCTFTSGTPSIVHHPSHAGQYILHTRWVNYSCDRVGTIVWQSSYTQLNSRCVLNSNMERISEEVFLQESYKESNGLEDIRMFAFQDKLYYSASFAPPHRFFNLMSCGEYEFQDTTYTLDMHTIVLADSPNTNHTEKNWSYVEYNGELCMVYKWFPLQIGKIDFNTNLFHITDVKHNVPDIFRRVCGGTPGYTFNDEIWFVVHICDRHTRRELTFKNYQHMFLVFDIHMNLLRYSECVKFENFQIEFCIGLIVETDRTIVSYSTMDCTSRVGILDNRYIREGIQWTNI